MQDEMKQLIKNAMDMAWDDYELTARQAQGAIESFLAALANGDYTIVKSQLCQIRDAARLTEV